MQKRGEILLQGPHVARAVRLFYFARPRPFVLFPSFSFSTYVEAMCDVENAIQSAVQSAVEYDLSLASPLSDRFDSFSLRSIFRFIIDDDRDWPAMANTSRIIEFNSRFRLALSRDDFPREMTIADTRSDRTSTGYGLH